MKTIGEKRVVVDFNVTKNDEVHSIKVKSAELIDMCESHISDNNTLDSNEWLKIAQRRFEEACMYAVKGLTNKGKNTPEYTFSEFLHKCLESSKEFNVHNLRVILERGDISFKDVKKITFIHAPIFEVGNKVYQVYNYLIEPSTILPSEIYLYDFNYVKKIEMDGSEDITKHIRYFTINNGK